MQKQRQKNSEKPQRELILHFLLLQQATGELKDLGRDIMWVGLSADEGKSWASVFGGKYNVGTITGTWVDVPRKSHRLGYINPRGVATW